VGPAQIQPLKNFQQLNLNNMMWKKIISTLFLAFTFLNSFYSQNRIINKESQIISMKILADSLTINLKPSESEKEELKKYRVVSTKNAKSILIDRTEYLLNTQIEIDSSVINYLVKSFKIPNSNLSINHTAFLCIFRNEAGKVIKVGFMAATEDGEYNVAIMNAINSYVNTYGWIRKNKVKKCSIVFYGIDFDEIRLLQG
jgi:hypothetical protein